MTKHSGYLRLFTTKISLYKIYNLWIWAAAFKLPSFFCLVAGGRFPTWFVERIKQRGLTTGLRLRRANAVRPYGMASLLLRFDLDFVCYEIIGFRRVVKLVRIKKRATKGRPYSLVDIHKHKKIRSAECRTYSVGWVVRFELTVFSATN